MARIKNLKGANPRQNKDVKAGWIVWGTGDTEGTPFATLAKKSGWIPCDHPHGDEKNFDEDVEWAIVLVCTERDLEAAGGKLDIIDGWAELSQWNKDVSPGIEEDEDEGDEDETEEEEEGESEEDEEAEDGEDDGDDTDEGDEDESDDDSDGDESGESDDEDD